MEEQSFDVTTAGVLLGCWCSWDTTGILRHEQNRKDVLLPVWWAHYTEFAFLHLITLEIKMPCWLLPPHRPGRSSPSPIPTTGLWNICASITALYSKYQPTSISPHSQDLERLKLPACFKRKLKESVALCCVPQAFTNTHKHLLRAWSVFSWQKRKKKSKKKKKKLWCSLPPSLFFFFFSNYLHLNFWFILSLINQKNSANDLRMDILVPRRQHPSKAYKVTFPPLRH